MAGSINLFQNIVAERNISISNQQGKWFFSALQAVPQGGGLYLFHDKVLTSIIPLKAPDDYVAKKVSVQVSKADSLQDFSIYIYVNNVKEKLITLPAGNTVAVSTIFVPIKENDQIALSISNDTGNTFSEFSDITVVIDYEYSEIYQEQNGNPFTINDVISSFNGSLTDISSSFETTKQEMAATYDSFSSSIFIDVDEFRNGISELQSDLSTTNLNLTSLQENYDLEIPALQTEAQNINESFLSLTTNVSSQVSEIGSNFTSLSSSLSNAQSLLSQHFYNLSGNLDQFDLNQISTNQQSISEITSDLTIKQDAIDSLIADVNSNYLNISTLTATVSENDENINSLLTQVSSALKSDINGLQSNIASVNSLLGYNINLNATNIQSLQNQLNNQQSSGGSNFDATYLENEISVLQTSSSLNASNISELQTTISTLDQDLLSVQVLIDSNTADIFSNSSDINNLTNTVNSIDSSKLIFTSFSHGTQVPSGRVEQYLSFSNGINTQEIPVLFPCQAFIIKAATISVDQLVETGDYEISLISGGHEIYSMVLSQNSTFANYDQLNVVFDQPQNGLQMVVRKSAGNTNPDWEFSQISVILQLQIL